MRHQRNKRVPSIISPSVRVAIGDIHLPFLTLVAIEDDHYSCLHEKRCLPEPRVMQGRLSGILFNKGLYYNKIPKETYEVIKDAINIHEKVQGYHLNPHTFMYTWCLSKGVDLYKEGILSY